MGPVRSVVILNSVRNPHCVIRDPVRNPEPHDGFNVGLGPRKAFDVQRGIHDGVRDPEIRAGSNAGSWCTTWGPGQRTRSRSPCGIQRVSIDVVRGPEFHSGFNPGSGIPYVIPNSVRHPMRDHLCRTGPEIPCRMHCGVRVPAHDHDFSAGPTAGSWLSWCVRNSLPVAQARILDPGRDPDIHAGFLS